MQGTGRVLFDNGDAVHRFPFVSVCQRGVAEALKAILTGGKGSAPGSRFTENEIAGSVRTIRIWD